MKAQVSWDDLEFMCKTKHSLSLFPNCSQQSRSVPEPSITSNHAGGKGGSSPALSLAALFAWFKNTSEKSSNTPKFYPVCVHAQAGLHTNTHSHTHSGDSHTDKPSATHDHLWWEDGLFDWRAQGWRASAVQIKAKHLTINNETASSFLGENESHYLLGPRVIVLWPAQMHLIKYWVRRIMHDKTPAAPIRVI